eukprot:CAMPEP_0194380456 /NCGR_PEP_ID=MMETSP0174-20130528/45221_1 /TAXON_ID=216777 /ORGANISM="Proboscia alata, Strain PI-D3" /LENGTH=36 /DNA_ID= /DNA_START= /DNA_END= /DNA_ORIENTATION=
MRVTVMTLATTPTNVVLEDLMDGDDDDDGTATGDNR